MKRLIWIVLALFLPCAAIAQEALYSISEVAAMTPEYYEGTCKLDGKRTIDFRAPVFVPDVESMPVVRVTHQMLDPEEAMGFKDLDSFENLINYQHLVLFKMFYEMVGDGSKSDSVGLESINNLWSNDAQANMHQIYAENQTFSLGDVVDGLEHFIETYNDSGFMPFYGRTLSAEYKTKKNGELTDQLMEYKNLTGLGSYEVDGWQCIDGIPVLNSIGRTQVDQGTGGRKSALRFKMSIRHGEIRIVDVRLPELYNLSMEGMLEKTGLLYADVPICSFDIIQGKLQEMVEKEELRYIYAVELGYMVYCDPEMEYSDDINWKEYDQLYLPEYEYLLLPVWQVEVSQKRSKTGRTLENFNGPEGGMVDSKYREKGQYNYISQDFGYEKLLFNAQTGELLNCKSWNPGDTKMLYPTKIITWEDVQ